MSSAEQKETGRSAPEPQQTKHNAMGHDERAIEQKAGSETGDDQTPQDILPPAQPQYILRGHSSQIHAVVFLRKNTRLLTGDADGWTVLWNLATKRPVAVWRAHDGPTLGLSEWTPNRIITHGRDTTLKVWQLEPVDESTFSTTLPVDDASSPRSTPRLLHRLTVNTITFCRFAFLREWYNVFNKTDVANGAVNLANSIYVAVPSTKDSSIDVYRLPTESVISTIRPPQVASSQNPMANVTGVGMVMAIGILYATPWRLTLIAGYESGHVCVQAFNPQSRTWSPIYLSQPHSQPILSLCVTPKSGFFYTSAADDIIAQHAISTSPFNLTAAGALELALSTPAQITHTKHSGQQSLTIRDDEKVLASAGWDASARVYSVKTLQELAVLKWHKEGCYAVAFAATEIDTPLPAGVETQMRGNDDLAAEPKAMPIENLSNKINITCTGKGKEPASGVVTNASRERERGITSARARREAKAQSTHWVAAGSKDGKVSLWDIY